MYCYVSILLCYVSILLCKHAVKIGKKASNYSSEQSVRRRTGQSPKTGEPGAQMLKGFFVLAQFRARGTCKEMQVVRPAPEAI